MSLLYLRILLHTLGALGKMFGSVAWASVVFSMPCLKETRLALPISDSVTKRQSKSASTVDINYELAAELNRKMYKSTCVKFKAEDVDGKV